MAVSSVDTLSGPYAPNGATTVFPFTFKAMAAAEVRVFRVSSGGVEVTVSDGAYDVTLAANGGSVIFASAPAAGDPLFIGTDPDFTQQITFENQGAFLPDVMNEAFDRAAVRDLALKRDLDRGVKVPNGETAPTLQAAAARAGKVAVFDANGDLLGAGAAVPVFGHDQAAIRRALADAGDLQTVFDALPADGTDDIRIAWDTGARVSTGDSLYIFIQTTLGYSSPQMTALLVTAQANDLALSYGASLDSSSIAGVMAQFADINGGELIGFRHPRLGSLGAVRTVLDKLGDVVDLRDFVGIDLTGVGDSTAGFQAAVDKAIALGEPLYIPAGVVRLTAPILITNTITFLGDTVGVGKAVAGYDPDAEIGKSTRLLFDHGGKGIRDGDGAALFDGVNFKGIIFSRNQPEPVDGEAWAPYDHDYDISMFGAAGLYFEDCIGLNPTRFCELAGGGGIGRLVTRNVILQPFKVGFRIRLSADIVRLEGTHFWPIRWDHVEVARYTLENCDHFYTERCDTPILIGCTSIGSRSFWRIGNSADGATTKGIAIGCAIDYSKYGYWFDTTSLNAWIYVGLGPVQAANSAGVVANMPAVTPRMNVKMEGASCRLFSSGMEIAGSSGTAIHLGTGNRMEVHGPLWVQSFGETPANTDPCIYAGVGSTFLLNGRIHNTTPGGMGAGQLVGGPGTFIGIRKAYIPSVTAGAGAYVSTPLIDSEYIEDGYRVGAAVNISIVNVGTGTGNLTISAPTEVDISWVAIALNLTTKEILAAQVIAGNPGTIQISKPGGGNVAVNGQVIGIKFDYVRKA